jgi:hypothetical protein
MVLYDFLGTCLNSKKLLKENFIGFWRIISHTKKFETKSSSKKS